MNTAESQQRDNFLDLHELLSWAGREVKRVNKASGWFDINRTFSEDIALLHSEVSEAFESYRTFGKVTCNFGSPDEQYAKDATGAELADVFIRLLDTCKRYGVDLGAEFQQKLEYNRGRSYRHGDKKL